VFFSVFYLFVFLFFVVVFVCFCFVVFFLFFFSLRLFFFFFFFFLCFFSLCAQVHGGCPRSGSNRVFKPAGKIARGFEGLDALGGPQPPTSAFAGGVDGIRGETRRVLKKGPEPGAEENITLGSDERIMP